MAAPGIVLAAPASGHGKTTATLGVLAALRRTGAKVGAFKVGPDYIDPAFHARATGGRPCPNLDSWAMRPETLAGIADGVAADVDLVVGEGVMGLFDGARVRPGAGDGSTADLASLLGLPVVLVVDARGMGASAAALVEGFIRHRGDVEVVGVIFNRVGGPGHAEVLREACDERFPQPVLGCLPRDPGLVLPERHLGLVQAGELPALDAVIARAADLVGEHVDLGRLRRLARPFGLGLYGPPPCPLRPLGQRIAVAVDEAFAFAYPAVLDGWRRAGAEIAPFSPLADEAPDPRAEAVYLPGGYPELHAGRLAGNVTFLGGLRASAARGAFVYGECGGFMALGRALVDADGEVHAMAGLLPVTTGMAGGRPHLGYRVLRLLEACPLGPAGAVLRGHEFHYALPLEADDAPALFEAADARGRGLGPTGARVGGVAGSFVHLIDRAAEPVPERGRAQHLRLVP